MKHIMKWGTWGTIYLLFALDYFIVSKPEKKAETCMFWIALVAFLIWKELIISKKEDK